MSAYPNVPDVQPPRQAPWIRTVRIWGPERAAWTAAMLGEADTPLPCDWRSGVVAHLDVRQQL